MAEISSRAVCTPGFDGWAVSGTLDAVGQQVESHLKVELAALPGPRLLRLLARVLPRVDGVRPRSGGRSHAKDFFGIGCIENYLRSKSLLHRETDAVQKVCQSRVVAQGVECGLDLEECKP